MPVRRKNLFGFGKKTSSGCATKSSMTIGAAKRAAFSEGRKTGDSKAFKDWLCKRGLQDRGNVTVKTLEKEFQRGVHAGQINTFEASNRIKEIAFDQGEQDARKNYDRNLSADEIPEYFSGQYDKEALIDVLGKPRIKSLYIHEYRQGQKKYKGEQSRQKAFEMKQKKTVAKQEKKKHERSVAATVQGKKIFKVGDHYEIQGGDSDFDTLQDAKNFIKSNPAKFDRCVKDVKRSARATGKPVNAYAVCTAGTRVASNSKSNKKGILVITGYEQATKRNKEDGKMYTGMFPIVQFIPAIQMAKLGYKWSDDESKRIRTGSDLYEHFAIRKSSNPVAKNALWSIEQGKIKGAVIRDGKRFKGTVTSGHGTQHHLFDTLKGAQAWVRLEVFHMASNPAAFVTGAIQALGSHVGSKFLKNSRGKVKKRRNPESAAAVAYEQFTGFPSERVTEIESTEHVHSVTWSAGQLIALVVASDINGKAIELKSNGWDYSGPKGDIGGKPSKSAAGWQFNESTKLEDITWLTCSEKGDQLFIQGGDQKLDVKALGFEQADIHDQMVIGTITRVWYRARKTFEAQGREQVDFYHDFGKEGSKGICPVLTYKPRDPSLQIYGGRYTIAKPEFSLGGVSPGIVG